MIIKKSLVRSFYSGMLVTCYECGDVMYVANQHGNWDVFEGGYTRDNRTRTLPAEAEEIKKVLSVYRKQGEGNR